MASYRHLARTCVMQTLFAAEFREKDADKFLVKILDEFAPKLTEREFAVETLKGVLRDQEKILKLIQEYAPQWPVEKIARIDRAILEIGVYEIAFSDGVPPVVAINEAIEIAKHFGDENSPKFINGVLSSVMKDYNNVEKKKK
ncbi:transcription antitermination factor NusB [Candidatus Peregrinibacteria bacterium]|jgi:transcription antitermination protein NusB|nr:transcription antitermination factor NusB [Candidatus Peregrinibacteria bacterium]